MINNIDSTFAALADPTRRGVIELLRERPRRAGEIAASFAMSPPAMSRHLRMLRRTGLITEDRLEDDARVRLYRLNPGPFSDLQTWLNELESLWTDQLIAFRELAENVDNGQGS